MVKKHWVVLIYDGLIYSIQSEFTQWCIASA